MRNLIAFPSNPPHIEYLVLIRDAKRVSGGTDHKALLIAKHSEIVSSYTALASAIEQNELDSIKPNSGARSDTSVVGELLLQQIVGNCRS